MTISTRCFTFLAVLTLFLFSCEKKPTTEIEQMSYAYGVQLAESAKKAGLELDPAMVHFAVRDVMKNKTLALSEAEVQTALLAMSRKAEELRLADGKNRLITEQKFVEDFAKQEGVKRSPGGIYYRIIKPGMEKGPHPTDKVKLHYTGYLSNGKIFDSTLQRGQASDLLIKALVPGWQEALRLMTAGAKWEIVIPPDLAYGTGGNSLIPPNSALRLEIELLAILPGKE